ncbi:AMP-dependent synthetase and ligase [Streptomyces laurentii]|uniref:AMP-dependent synthetase and ligase n=1 Tax=Streptomyces laurentii TaxID=39478 RepID=A0A160P777_STRLU|nr:AMP-dependent synthetase and ligase [Streptomyces laurentii]
MSSLSGWSTIALFVRRASGRHKASTGSEPPLRRSKQVGKPAVAGVDGAATDEAATGEPRDRCRGRGGRHHQPPPLIAVVLMPATPSDTINGTFCKRFSRDEYAIVHRDLNLAVSVAAAG